MKVFVMVLLIVFTLIPVTALNAQQGRLQWSSQGKYNPAIAETLQGTVEEVHRKKETRGKSSMGMHLVIKSGKTLLDVHLGPASYIEGKMTFVKGDRITIAGSPAEKDGKKIIIARSVKKGASTLHLRKEDGTPLWAGYYDKGKKR